MKNNLQIAIDGPVGAGKSDIASRLAKDLGITYIYTGAMYRALALTCKKNNIPCEKEEAVTNLLDNMSIELAPPESESKYPVQVFVNSKEVTNELFTPLIDALTPVVSRIGKVRQLMVKRQQDMAGTRSVVMEGRDIGLRVLPKAQLKIYLTASLEERARRRWEQMKQKGIEKLLSDVVEDTKKRDLQDTMRDVDPLQKLPDAWEFDTTGLSQEAVVEKIHQELLRRNLL